MHDDLAKCLRAWRDRLDPVEAGLPSHAPRRRAPGLRREEVAAQAGISVNYLMRLEQGRASTPSVSVVASLARALRLNTTEAAHLHRLAGHADTARVAARHITPSVQRLLARFDDVPVIVIDPAWTIVAANPLAGALLADDLIGQNVARRHFVGPQWVEREAEDEQRFARELVGDLHLQLARHPDDSAVRAIISELHAASDRFATLWADPPASASSSSRKTFRHPAVGTVTLDCDVLEVVGSDLRVVLWTATPGSPDASALALLGVVGLQHFAT